MIKNKATLKFKNFIARPRSFLDPHKARASSAALCCARPTEAVCLEISSIVAKPSEVGKNLKSLNFKNRNVTGADYDADRDINFNAYRNINSSADHSINSNADRNINSRRDRAVNFKISNANLKADLARPKAGFR